MVPLIIGGAIAAGSIASNLYNSYKNREDAAAAYDEIKRASDAAVNANAADIQGYKNLIQNTYGQGAANYQDALAKFLNSDVYQNQDFSYNGDINQFFDPAANQRWEAEMSAINNASATGGNRFSSDYVNRVGARAQAHTSEEWEKAYNKLMQDRNQALAEYNVNSANAWNNYNATQDRAKYGIDQYGNDRNMLTQGLGDATMAAMNNRLGGLQTQANVAAGRVNALQNQNAGSAISSGLGGLSTFLGSYYGGKGS